MLLSEALIQKEKVHKIQTIKVKYVRDLLFNSGKAYETLNGKKVYVLYDGKWYTCNGNKPLNHKFIIMEE